MTRQGIPAKPEETKSTQPTASSEVRKAFEDGLYDGEQLGLYRAYRIVMAQKKLHAPNSGAGRVLKELAKIFKEG